MHPRDLAAVLEKQFAAPKLAAGDRIELFNGRDGQWRARIAVLETLIARIEAGMSRWGIEVPEVEEFVEVE